MRNALVAAASVAALATGMATAAYAQTVGGGGDTSTVTDSFNDNSMEDNSDNSTNVGDVSLDASDNSDNSVNDSYNSEDNSDNSTNTDASDNSDHSINDSYNPQDNSDNSIRVDTDASDNSDHSIEDSYNDSSSHRTSLSTQTLTGSVTGTAVSFAAPTTGDQNGAFTTGDVAHSGDSFSGSAGVHVTGSNTGFAANVQSASGIAANADITFGSP